MDLARRWIENIGGVQPPGTGSKGAKTVFQIAQTKHWTRMKNSPKNFPLAGDIVVFDAKNKNKFGHIAIARDGCDARTLTFDQNWSEKRRCTIEKHGYTKDKVIGWIRKKS